MITGSVEPLSHKRVLVTGGAGFIGSHLVEQLVQCGNQVTVVDNLTTGHYQNIQTVQARIEFIEGDLNTLLQTGQLKLSSYSHIFHLAANAYVPPSVVDPLWDFQLNLQTTLLLLEAMRRLDEPPQLIYASSAAVYGNPTRLPIHEDDPTVPISPYGVAKLAAERYVTVYCQLYGLRAASLRLFSVYGPRQRKQVVYDLLTKLQRDPGCVEVFGDGSQERDFVYVTDVVQAMLIVARYGPNRGEVYNVASGLTYKIRDLLAAWCEVCALQPRVVYRGNVRPGDAERWSVNTDRIAAIGYKAHTVLEDGLKQIWSWYRHESD